MTSPKSPIKDLYSSDIPIDPNGKTLPWLWVVLLPFIDENRITSAMELCLPDMSEEEKRRNSFGKPYMFLHRTHPLFQAYTNKFPYESRKVTELSKSEKDDAQSSAPSVDCYTISPALEGGGIGGTLCAPDATHFFPLSAQITAPDRPLGAFRNVLRNDAACLEFGLPPELPHLSSLLPGADSGDDVLTPYDAVIRIPRLNRGLNIVGIARGMKSGNGYEQSDHMNAAMQGQYHRQQAQLYGEQQGLRASSNGSGWPGAGQGWGGTRAGGSAPPTDYSYRNQSLPFQAHGDTGWGGHVNAYQSRSQQGTFPPGGNQQQGVYSQGSGYNGYGGNFGQSGYGGRPSPHQQQQYGSRSSAPSFPPHSQYALPSPAGGQQYSSMGYNLQQGTGGYSMLPNTGYGGGSYQQQPPQYPSYPQRQQHSYPPYQEQQQRQQYPSYSSRLDNGASGGRPQDISASGNRQPPRGRGPPHEATPPSTAPARPSGFSFRDDLHSSSGRQPAAYGASGAGGSAVGGSIAGLRMQLSGNSQYGGQPSHHAPPTQQAPLNQSRDPRLRR